MRVMDCDEDENPGPVTASSESIFGNAVTPTILNYYKKFGRKRDLEQYFSLSTAQSDVRDPSGDFWRKMKSENDSSDSGEKKNDSSQELCRISIRCALPDPCSSQYHVKPKPILTGSALLESLGINIKPMDESSKTKSDSVSPPIITEEAAQDVTQNSDEESVKSNDNNSQKSFDVLDTSTNKPLSPSSSITSQRKLEWDSLADVGYANESDRKTSASSLSTLERLALKQQYSNNDTKLDSILEPTAHSTPLEENEAKTKKKGVGKKSTKIYKKDVDYLEVNVPHSSENNPSQSINVNLTKHISFNVEKDGKVTVENIKRDVSVSPDKNAVIKVSPRVQIDKEMQTSLIKSKNIPDTEKNIKIPCHKIPVLISLTSLRRQTRRKKLKTTRKKLKSKKKLDTDNAAQGVVQEKSGEQLSEAESFEYMPGHMYNQNQLTVNERSGTTAGNKSSLESSGPLTTDSSKGSKHSFTKDLQKSIDILKAALPKGDDANLRKQLIKQVCERLVNSKYRDDESTSDFLSGLSLNSKKRIGEKKHSTTSTSDNSTDKLKKPKKSILRNDKFNAGAIASTSQSAPNLPAATNSDNLVFSSLMKNLTSSNTESDLSNKEKSSTDYVFAKTSSQELYQKYLDALKREEAYKRHLKDKELFLKQKLVCSDSAIKARPDPKVNSRLKDLIKDLTRNNYDDGSGDASKLEGGPNSSRDNDRFVPLRSQRSHSVFTLSSSGNIDSNNMNKKQNIRKRLQSDLKDLAQPGTSKDHYCCCPHHSLKSKAGCIDSSVQVNIKRPCGDSTCEHRNVSPRVNDSHNGAKIVSDDATEDIKYVCLCNNKTIKEVPDNFLIFKCSRLAKGNEEATSSKSSNASCHSRNTSPRKNKDSPNVSVMQSPNITSSKKNSPANICAIKTTTKSSQTNFLLKILRRKSSEHSGSCDSKTCSLKSVQCYGKNPVLENKVYEATRCLQTEISINPRIPEPSLSDINIVTECAILVSEHCRILPKPSVTDIYSHQTNIENRSSRSSKSSGTSKEMGELLDDDIALGNEKPQDNETEPIRKQDSDCSENFKIPIQGTNMTLMVSIDSNERKVTPDNVVNLTRCVGTEKIVTEQATSLTEECSKGVQYDEPSNKTDQNINNVGISKNHIKNPCMANTCLATEDATFNTYPKTSPVNERKSFRRANTDTDFGSKCAKPENKSKTDEKCDKKAINQCAVQHTVGSKASVELPVDSPCLCGCYGNKETCNEKCTEVEQSSPTKCTCGCSGTIDKCNKYCDDRRKKSISSQCSGDKKKCIKDCSELKKRSSKEIGIQKDLESITNESPRDTSENKSKSPERKDGSGMSLPVDSLCLCGCDGKVDTCNKDCDSLKKSLTINEKRCGGNIDNCKKECEYRKSSISSQCSCGCSRDKNKCKKDCSELKKGSSKEIGIQKDLESSSNNSRKETSESKSKSPERKGNKENSSNNSRRETSESKSKSPERKGNKDDCSMPSTSKNICDGDKQNKSPDGSETDTETDPILEIIQNITKKYSKKDDEKGKRKKCFKEIMAVLNYLLETDDSTAQTKKQINSTSPTTPGSCEKPEKKSPCLPKKIQNSKSKTKPCITESSEFPQSTDIPGTSSDSGTCKVLNKIKQECERYHQKRCKIHSGKKCEVSSSTSANCDQCRRVHHCYCRNHKCKAHKKAEKIQKKAVAYNLILQTSESISEETVCKEQRQLQNIVVKVPKKSCNMPFKEMCAKIESRMPPCSPRESQASKTCRSRSVPNESEISSMEEFLRKSQACCTVREYLEQNRPDFIAKSSQRQNCLRIVSDSRANMRAAQRDLLSVRLAQLSDVNDLDSDEVRQLARDLGRHMRQKRPAPKFISEREMKKHSEDIYKSLPEVIQKKEEARKDKIKKTNLLMANIFKKNLQKKTLRGSVDISNYSTIIKI